MVSTLASAVVIECPHCGTRYQLPPEAIGPKGRQVACAHCGRTWQAKALAKPADDDTLFDEASEKALDEAFAAEERTGSAVQPVAPREPSGTGDEPERLRSIAEIKAAIAPRQKPATTETPGPDGGYLRRQRAFDNRQAALSKQSPLARVRRILRSVGVVALLGLIAGGFIFRAEIVRQFPDLAGTYEALGLGVNVVGLEFRDVTTLMTLRQGTALMQVDARIFSVAARKVDVPPVVVTLLDADGRAIYEWSVTPPVSSLQPGELVDFTTQLSGPPPGASRVRLNFTDGAARAESPVEAAATEQ